jgi:hypothetical protein
MPDSKKPTIRSLFDEIDHKHTKPLDYQRLNREHPEPSSGLVQDMERNWEEAKAMYAKAMERYHEHDNSSNFEPDNGDRRNDRREVIFGVRVVSGDGHIVSYDRMRAAGELRHWREYIEWASAKVAGRPYLRPCV